MKALVGIFCKVCVLVRATALFIYPMEYKIQYLYTTYLKFMDSSVEENLLSMNYSSSHLNATLKKKFSD